MGKETMTLDQIRSAGLAALHRELGPVGMIRFLQQFETGSGDYSSERHGWLDTVSLDALVRDLRQRHPKK